MVDAAEVVPSSKRIRGIAERISERTQAATSAGLAGGRAPGQPWRRTPGRSCQYCAR